MASHVEGEKEAGGPLYREEKDEKGRDYYNIKLCCKQSSSCESLGIALGVLTLPTGSPNFCPGKRKPHTAILSVSSTRWWVLAGRNAPLSFLNPHQAQGLLQNKSSMNVGQVSQWKHSGQRTADLNNIPEAHLSSTCAAYLLPHSFLFFHSVTLTTVLTSSGQREQAHGASELFWRNQTGQAITVLSYHC